MSVVIDQLTIRLYHSNDKDKAIADYLAQFDRSTQGIKGAQTKELLYLGLQALERQEECSPDLDAIRQLVREEISRAAGLDSDTVRRAVQDALDAADVGAGVDFTLADIRQVVSVVLQQQLDSLNATHELGHDDDGDVATDAETDDVLDRLGDSLLME